MCDPVTLTGLALSAGGQYMQTRDANKNMKRATNAKNDVYEKSMIKQRQFADESGQAFGQNTRDQGRESFDEQSDIETDRVKTAFGNNRVQPDYNVGLVDSAPKNVLIARQAASDEAGAETDRDVENSARLNSYGNTLFSQGLKNSQFGRAFGGIQDKASRDMRILPLDLQSAATNSQKKPSMLGPLMSMAGSAMGMYGAANPGTTFMNTNVPTSGIGPFKPGMFTQAGRGVKQLFGSQVGM